MFEDSRGLQSSSQVEQPVVSTRRASMAFVIKAGVSELIHSVAIVDVLEILAGGLEVSDACHVLRLHPRRLSRMLDSAWLGLPRPMHAG